MHASELRMLDSGQILGITYNPLQSTRGVLSKMQEVESRIPHRTLRSFVKETTRASPWVI
jgi:hypothetical protein